MTVPDPVCIGCHHEGLLFGADQAFCMNEDCRVLTWNPNKTVDENLDGVNFIDLSFAAEEDCGGGKNPPTGAVPE